MKAILPVVAATTILVPTAPSFSQTPAILSTTPAAKVPTDTKPGAAHQTALGVPGFYDPSTRMFTPLTAGTQIPAAASVSGQTQVNVKYNYSKDLAGRKTDATAIALVLCYFLSHHPRETPPVAPTPAANTPTVDGTEQTGTNFSTQSPVSTFSRQFTFVPQGTGPEIQFQISVQAFAPNGANHRATITLPAQSLKSGTTVRSVTVNL